ncbi:MAG: S26 family signal peptidase [Proteobacteria bacterium]|nr:S26 family signal peptidase [Pseudomonadota bacterium]
MRTFKKTYPIFLALLAMAAISLIANIYSGKVHYNYTDSVPIGFYKVNSQDKSFSKGELVIYSIPDNSIELINERRYIRPGDSLIKPIAATNGDKVCWNNAQLFINGVASAKILKFDSNRRAMPQLSGCIILKEGEYLPLTQYPDSFDGRYHGIIRTDSIIGKATALWV